MKTPFLYAIFIILLSRILFQLSEKPLSIKKLIAKISFELLFLTALAVNLYILILYAIIIGINLTAFFLDQDEKKRALYRFFNLCLYVIIFSFLIGDPLLFSAFNPEVILLKIFFSRNNIIFQYITQITMNHLLAYMIGVILVTNEINIIIRHILISLKITPQKNTAEENNSENSVAINNSLELKRGKIIGIIERLLIYYFITHNSLSSVGFILAAKGLTRFKELDDKNFAEYFLIGTLLSTVLAILSGVLIQKLLSP